jgi:hypothetical protein
MQRLLDFVAELAGRKISPSWFRTRDWAQVAPAIRRRAFFSSTVQSARLLTKYREMLLDWMSAATEEVTAPDGTTSIAYKETGLAKFRERAQRFAIQEGLATTEDFKDQRITNVISNSRLALIYNTNQETAAEFADYQSKVLDPDYINLFPAAEFKRSPGGNPEFFRPIHVANTGQIRRWDDTQFWLAMNDRSIGGFGVPWGPWGFNSYMYQSPVKRSTAIRLGLVRPDERVRPPDLTAFGVEPSTRFNAGVEMPMQDVTPEVRSKAQRLLTSRYGPGAIGSDGQPTLDLIRRIKADIRAR